MIKLFFKRLVKVIISCIYFIVLSLNNIFSKIFRGFASARLIIVMYHSIHSDQKDEFLKHVYFAKRAGILVFPEITNPLYPGKRHIAITFDDGFENFWQNGFPILQEHNIPSTVFVPTNFIGSRPGWIKDKSNRNIDEKVMSTNQLVNLPPDIVKIGSHGKSHSPLAKLNNEEIKNELEGSRQLLEQMLGREVRLLALPHGSFTPDIEEISLRAGYDRIFFCVPISTPTNFTNILAGRVDVTLSDWPIEYKLKYLGAYQWERYIFKLKTILRPVLNWN